MAECTTNSPTNAKFGHDGVRWVQKPQDSQISQICIFGVWWCQLKSNRKPPMGCRVASLSLTLDDVEPSYI